MKKFSEMSAYEKGYAVYMLGERDDVPEVPSSYEPSPEERAEYERGQLAAVLVAQDSEE